MVVFIMSVFRPVLSCFGALVTLSAPLMSAEWMSDFDAAQKRAAVEDKLILINFTGSDWCGYCMRMKAQVLDTPEFAEYAADKYVLLEIDLPRRKQLDADTVSKRQDLCRRYDVTGFPTYVMTTASGEVVGGFSGARPNFEGTRVYLDNALARRAMLDAARKKQGRERAAALMEVYESFPKSFKQAAAALRVEIAQHDPEDSTGLQQRAEADAQMLALTEELSFLYRDYQAQSRVFDAYIAKAHPLNKERIMERKRDTVVFPCLNIMLLNADSVEDINAARDYVLREAEISYPDSIKAEMIKALQQQFADPEALLREVRARRKR